MVLCKAWYLGWDKTSCEVHTATKHYCVNNWNYLLVNIFYILHLSYNIYWKPTHKVPQTWLFFSHVSQGKEMFIGPKQLPCEQKAQPPNLTPHCVSTCQHFKSKNSFFLHLHLNTETFYITFTKVDIIGNPIVLNCFVIEWLSTSFTEADCSFLNIHLKTLHWCFSMLGYNHYQIFNSL